MAALRFSLFLTMLHALALSSLSSFAFLLFSFFFFLLSSFSSFSFPFSPQPAKPPILATVEAVPVRGTVKAGSAVTLAVKVTPRKGIHVYAPPQDKYKPVTLTLEPTPGLRAGKPNYPASTMWTFEGERVRVYEAPFVIEVPARVDAEARGPGLTVAGELRYQACDDLICYLPVKVPLRWNIRIQ